MTRCATSWVLGAIALLSAPLISCNQHRTQISSPVATHGRQATNPQLSTTPSSLNSTDPQALSLSGTPGGAEASSATSQVRAPRFSSIPTVNSTGAIERECRTLASESLKVDVQAMSLKMNLDMMTVQLSAQNLAELQQGLLQLQALDLQQPSVRRYRDQYIRSLRMALQPIEQWHQQKDVKVKKTTAERFAHLVEQSSDFRKEKIFGGDCKVK